MNNIYKIQDQEAQSFGFKSIDQAAKHLGPDTLRLIYSEAGYRFGRNVQDACAEIVRGYPHLEKKIAQLNLNSN